MARQGGKELPTPRLKASCGTLKVILETEIAKR